jgi:hypothetical protein
MNIFAFKSLNYVTLLISTTLLVAACGGGGGGNAPAPAPAPSPQEPRFQLSPFESSIKPNNSKLIVVDYCPVDAPCAPLSQVEPTPLIFGASRWFVNGILGGNSTVGTVTGDNFQATYTAPAKAPLANPVAVSAQIPGGQGATSRPDLTVIANIKIDGAGGYTGKVLYTTYGVTSILKEVDKEIKEFEGQADVVWTLDKTIGSSKYYKGSGTITGKLLGYAKSSSSYTCAPIDISVPMDEIFSELTIDTQNNSYSVGIRAVSGAGWKLSCTWKSDGKPFEETISSTVVLVRLNGCPNSTPPVQLTYTDINRISGIQPLYKEVNTCRDQKGEWDFAAQSTVFGSTPTPIRTKFYAH